MAQEMEPGMIRVCPERDAICPHGMACPYSRDYECDMKGSRAELDRTRAKVEPAPSQEPDRDSLRIARQFADMYRSGAQGAEMDCDAAQALALAIDDILSVPAPSPPADIAGLVDTFIVNNFHGQGARELASALQRVAQERETKQAEIERLQAIVGKDPNTVMIAFEDGAHQRLSRAAGDAIRRAEAAEARLSSARDEGLEMAAAAIFPVLPLIAAAIRALKAPTEGTKP